MSPTRSAATSYGEMLPAALIFSSAYNSQVPPRTLTSPLKVPEPRLGQGSSLWPKDLGDVRTVGVEGPANSDRDKSCAKESPC